MSLISQTMKAQFPLAIHSFSEVFTAVAYGLAIGASDVRLQTTIAFEGTLHSLCAWRSIRLRFLAAEGNDAVFQDVTDLLGHCRFRDCTHLTKTGCAVRQAVADGQFDEARLLRWDKLKREDQVNAETPAEARERNRRFGRQVKKSLASKSRHGGKGWPNRALTAAFAMRSCLPPGPAWRSLLFALAQTVPA